MKNKRCNNSEHTCKDHTFYIYLFKSLDVLYIYILYISLFPVIIEHFFNDIYDSISMLWFSHNIKFRSGSKVVHYTGSRSDQKFGYLQLIVSTENYSDGKSGN